MKKTLNEKDFYVDPDIRRAESLPASAFTDEEFLERELETIFSRTWLFIPQDLRDGPGSLWESMKPEGSRVPFSILNKPLFLQRGSRGQLHCFPNVCTHAWHPLVVSPEVGGRIICPQHGRQFNSDGRFVSQAGFEKLEIFPRESDHLKSLPVEEWGQFAFVCLGGPFAPFQDFAKEVQESLFGLALEKLRWRPTGTEAREVDGNWKQHAWNYMDNFHIRFVHKGPGGLADAIDLPSYRTELYRFSSLQWVYARKPENGFDAQLLNARFRDPKDPDRRVFALWWFVFPNLTFNFYPWGLAVNVYGPVPGRPDKTQFLWYHYVLDVEKFQHRNELWLSEQVDAEDIEAIGLVSRGAQSGFAPRGRFAPLEEAGPHWFHRLVYEAVFEK